MITFLPDKLPYVGTNPIQTTCFLVAITTGSVAPDLDLPGRPLAFLGHRKLTHTLLCPAIVVLLMLIISHSQAHLLAQLVNSILFGFMFGYVLHVLADLFQSKGVPLFWPLIWNNVHVMNMPVQYDHVWFVFYCLILGVIIAITSDARDAIKNLLTSTPGIFIAIVLALLIIKKKQKGKRR